MFIDCGAEIKTLDGEMQNLVYENYSKFITATDTIRKVLYTPGGHCAHICVAEIQGGGYGSRNGEIGR